MKFKVMLSLALVMLSPANVTAEYTHIQQTDAWAISNTTNLLTPFMTTGRIIETDPIGNKQYNQQQQQIKGNEIYQTDSVGNIQYNKPHQLIK